MPACVCPCREAITRFARSLRLLALAVGIAAPAGEAWAAPPARVVSLNLCLDQIALALAAPGQLVGISDVAHDPHLSARWREAQALPAVRMRIEEVLALRPDMVLLDASAPPHVMALLRRAGVRVVALAEAATFDDGLARVQTVAMALGRTDAGTMLAGEMRRRSAALAGGPRHGQPLAAVWQANGFTMGIGTLADDLLRRAGFRNLAAERGMGAFDPLPLEVLVRSAPDLLILDGDASDRPSLAEALMNHPAARRAFPGDRTLVMSPNLWLCAGPQNIQALERLTATRQRLGPSR